MYICTWTAGDTCGVFDARVVLTSNGLSENHRFDILFVFLIPSEDSWMTLELGLFLAAGLSKKRLFHA